MAAGDNEPIKAIKNPMLAFPEGRDGSGTGEIGVHTLGVNLFQVHLTHGTAKRLEGTSLSTKTHAHRLLMSDIVGSCLRELHDSPLRSKSATSRSPAKSTRWYIAPAERGRNGALSVTKSSRSVHGGRTCWRYWRIASPTDRSRG